MCSNDNLNVKNKSVRPSEKHEEAPFTGLINVDLKVQQILVRKVRTGEYKNLHFYRLGQNKSSTSFHGEIRNVNIC